MSPITRDEAQAKAIELAMLGISGQEIARQVGYPQPTISKWLSEARRAGIPIPEAATGPNPRPTPRKDEARRLRAAGHSIPEIAQKLEAPEPTIYRWLREDPRAPVPIELEPPAEVDAPGPTPQEVEAAALEADIAGLGTGGLLANMRRQYIAMARRAAAAERDGMHAVGQRYSRDMVQHAATIQREEARLGEQKDGIKVSKEEIEAGWSKVLATVEAITARPLLCEHCSRELSISLAGRDSLEP